MDSEDGVSPQPAGSPDEVCEECGETIATTDWYPIAKERTADGSLRLYPFCSEGCKTRWLDDGAAD